MFDRVRDFLLRRRQAYVQTFSTPYGKRVLEDLAQFCRAGESTFHDDPRVSAMLDGRREVFLRICQHVRLSPHEMYDLFTGRDLPAPEPRTVVSDGDFEDD